MPNCAPIRDATSPCLEADQTTRRVVAVVVTFNRQMHIQKTTARFLALPADQLCALVVVDNASTDGTADWLAAQRDPRLKVVRAPRNLGGAGGFDLGMRNAMAHCEPDWLLVTDDDGRPMPDALERFQSLDLSGWDALAARVQHPDGTISDWNRPSLNPFWRTGMLWAAATGKGRDAFHLSARDMKTGAMRQVDGASFVGFFLRADSIARFGYPDPSLFIYGDDAHYTLSLTRKGGRIGFDPSVQFEHDNAEIARDFPRMRPLWKVYYYHRNLIALYRMATGAWFWLVMLYYLPVWAARARLYGADTRAFWRLWRRGVADGLLNRPTMAHDQVLALAGCPASAQDADQRVSNSRAQRRSRSRPKTSGTSAQATTKLTDTYCG